MPSPTPPTRHKWPFRNWTVGETAFFATPIRLTQIAAHGAGHANGWRFVTQTRTEDGQCGVRVWMVA